jgi:hypothetical protein
MTYLFGMTWGEFIAMKTLLGALGCALGVLGMKWYSTRRDRK